MCLALLRYEPPVATPFHYLSLAISVQGLRAVLWPGDQGGNRVRLDDVKEGGGDRSVLVTQTIRQLDEYFRGDRTTFDLPLDLVGTAFQKDVWTSLATIPFGQTRSYKEQAEALGRPKAIRAVAAANGRNPISIILPCHRVIGSNASLTGFAGGLEAKQWLLAFEKGNGT